MSDFKLSASQIKKNIETVQVILKEQNLDCFYASSGDIFLSEYVPMCETHRYYFSGFTGSTGDIVIPKTGKVFLYVDGRYHEQADIEADKSLIEVVKCSLNQSFMELIEEHAKNHDWKKMAIEATRVSFKTNDTLKKFIELNDIDLILKEKIAFTKYSKVVTPCSVDKSLTGLTVKEKLEKVLKTDEAMYIGALDQIAWISNMRGFEFPFQATFAARAFLTREKLYILSEHTNIEITDPSIVHIKGDVSDTRLLIEKVKTQKFNKVFYGSAICNVGDYNLLISTFGKDKLEDVPNGLIFYMAHKNEAELKAIRENFKKGDKAIFDVISWAKEQVKNKKRISELDLYNETTKFYQKTGSLEQSFSTIPGFGANASIIHYGSPSNDVVFTENEMVLLDTGGYWENGYATDTTRTFLTGGTASAKQKEIYTLTLKGLLHAINTVFPVGTTGAHVDGVVRMPLYRKGYDYNHGTGHGVGINVHEGGYRIGPKATSPLTENTIGSIEPGIYIPGFGGVRLENIVHVEKHPTFPNMLRLTTLVYIGFDHELIEPKLLTDEEKVWLDEYEAECKKRGTSFRN